MDETTAKRISACDSLREEAVGRYLRGDVVLGEQARRQADSYDPRVPAGHGPQVRAAADRLWCEAHARVTFRSQ